MGLVLVALLLALVIIVSTQVLGKAPTPTHEETAPGAPPAPAPAPRPSAREPTPAPSLRSESAPALPGAPALSLPVTRVGAGDRTPAPAAAAGAQESMTPPLLARPESAAALHPTTETGPALRACRECLSVIADPSSESCPVCGGDLAPQRQLGAPGLVRNPMQVVDDESLRGWIGTRLDDMYGARIGTVESVVLDPETEVIWLLVRVQRFGDWHTLVPAQGAMLSNGRLLVRYPRGFVRDGPRGLTTDAYLWGPYRSRLYRYYRPPGKPRNRSPEPAVADKAAVAAQPMADVGAYASPRPASPTD